MNVTQIIDRIIKVSGRKELRDNREEVLQWLNDYKKSLQIAYRYFISEKTDTLDVLSNNRTTPLPDDFLFPICIRRPRAGLVGTQQDINGSQFTVTKNTILKQIIVRQDFFDIFPLQRDDGELNTGVNNNYIFQGTDIVWGPIPSESETIYIDYFGMSPAYSEPNIVSDAFTTYYDFGLFAHGMYEVFDSWIPDETKSKMWLSRRLAAEYKLQNLNIHREKPMEVALELPDN